MEKWLIFHLNIFKAHLVIQVFVSVDGNIILGQSKGFLIF